MVVSRRAPIVVLLTVHLTAAMVLPAIAVAATAIACRWRPFLVVAVVIFLVALPGNVGALSPSGPDRFTLSSPRALILSLPRLPMATEVPRGWHPLPFTADQVTVGWLLDARVAGRLPDPGPIISWCVVPRSLRCRFASSTAVLAVNAMSCRGTRWYGCARVRRSPCPKGRRRCAESSTVESRGAPDTLSREIPAQCESSPVRSTFACKRSRPSPLASVNEQGVNRSGV